MLIEALQYLKLGWSVVPCCWPISGKCGCGRNHEGNDIGKAPLVSWREFQKTRPSTDQVTSWWTQWPLANIAVLTGAISGLGVVDLEHEGIPEAERLGIWSPLKAYTGKGWHYYFRHPGERLGNKVAFKKVRGLDVRGDGGYVMAAPSRHATGRRYTWASAPTVGGQLPAFPSALFADSVATETGKTVKAPLDIAEALGGLANGNRNNTLAQVVGKLHRGRWTPSDIRSLLLPHALRVQFPEGELDTIIGSVTRYPVAITGSGRGGLVRDGAGQPVSGNQPPAKLIVRTFGADWDDYRKRQLHVQNREFATGYRKFDTLIGGGLQPEELLAVAGWTGVGKTNWLLGLCVAMCLRGKRVLYLSTEMSYRKIWDRYIPLVGTEESSRGHAFIVSDEFIPSVGAIRDAIIDHKPDVLIFDHIHNVSEEHSEVGEYMKRLKEYVKEFQIPGVVACQFSKIADFTDPKTGQRITPRMSMIKGASAIIQVAAQVLLLDERDDSPEQKEIIGILDKNRDGEKGLINFVLKKHPYRMEEGQ